VQHGGHTQCLLCDDMEDSITATCSPPPSDLTARSTSSFCRRRVTKNRFPPTQAGDGVIIKSLSWPGVVNSTRSIYVRMKTASSHVRDVRKKIHLLDGYAFQQGENLSIFISFLSIL
jgi:hypothetical protein